MLKAVNLFTTEDVVPWKDINIEGKLVILKIEFFVEKYRDAKYQLVLASGGFGCSPDARGNAIFVKECHNDNPETYRIERCSNDILGIATEKAIKEWKEIYGEFNEKVIDCLKKRNNMRCISLSDGTGMGDSVFVFQTDAPIEELRDLERISCDIYINGGDAEDVPIWANVLTDKGFTFEYVDEHQHITPFGTSTEWLKQKYPEVKEHYQIENQPNNKTS